MKVDMQLDFKTKQVTSLFSGCGTLAVNEQVLSTVKSGRTHEVS